MKNQSIRRLVDQLGYLKASIASIQEQEKQLKEKLIESGLTEVDGYVYRATISTADRENVDVAALKSKVSPQFLAAHTTVRPVTTVRVVSRQS